MTPKYKNHNEVEKVYLEDILQTVMSIDSKVDDVLETMRDRNDVADYDPAWDRDNYLDAYEY